MTDNIENAIQYFKENDISISKCAKQFNIHRETLTKYLKLFNIHEDRRAYKINDDFFTIIDTEAKAYWLGFILADGCLKRENVISINLSVKDIDHLKKFKTDIESERPIIIESRNAFDSSYEICNFKIQNKKLIEAIKKHGIDYNKSKQENFSKSIPKHLMNHYIRGIYDGDGWITWNLNHHTYEIGIGMGETCLKKIKEQLELVGIKSYPVLPYKNIFRYRITSKIEIKKTLEYLYKDATIYLNRKYMKFIDFCRLESKANTTEDSR